MIWPRFIESIKLSFVKTVVKQVNLKLESDKGEICTELLVWNQLIISSCFELCDVQRFHCQKICAIKGPVLYPYKNKKSVWHCFTLQFFCIFITLACGSQVHGSYNYVTMTFGLISGSIGVTHFQHWIWHAFWYENLWGYQDNFIHKNSLLL